MRLYLQSGERNFEMEVTRQGEALRVREGNRTWTVSLDGRAPGCRRAWIDGRRVDFAWARRDDAAVISIDGLEIPMQVRDARTALLEQAASAVPRAAGPATVRAPIPGLVTKIRLRVGARVKRHEPVLILDAMKLENEITSPREGVLRSIDVKPGQAVDRGQVLFIVAGK